MFKFPSYEPLLHTYTEEDRFCKCTLCWNAGLFYFLSFFATFRFVPSPGTDRSVSTVTEKPQRLSLSVLNQRSRQPPHFCLFTFNHHTYQMEKQKGFLINIILKLFNNYVSNKVNNLICYQQRKQIYIIWLRE